MVIRVRADVTDQNHAVVVGMTEIGVRITSQKEQQFNADAV